MQSRPLSSGGRIITKENDPARTGIRRMKPVSTRDFLFRIRPDPATQQLFEILLRR